MQLLFHRVRLSLHIGKCRNTDLLSTSTRMLAARSDIPMTKEKFPDAEQASPELSVHCSWPSAIIIIHDVFWSALGAAMIFGKFQFSKLQMWKNVRDRRFHRHGQTQTLFSFVREFRNVKPKLWPFQSLILHQLNLRDLGDIFSF